MIEGARLGVKGGKGEMIAANQTVSIYGQEIATYHDH